jgi:flavin reductase (DIM6/NTAB) family NADH-FMN oxidoreductase RutF
MTPAENAGFRRVAGRFASGIMVVSTTLDGADHAMTVTAFCSVSLQPQLVLFCA